MLEPIQEITAASLYGLEVHGLRETGAVHWNLNTAALYEHAIRRREAMIAVGGALVVNTGTHTGRSPNDKYIVRDAETENVVWWDNNKSLDPLAFDHLHSRMIEYFSDKEVYVQDCYAGADPEHRLNVRVITEFAWHSLFARTMFINPPHDELLTFMPGFTIIDAPFFEADPARDGTASSTFIVINFSRKLVLIGGTEYAGEIKKSVFTVLNYLLPRRGVLSMHCSANYGSSPDDAALFFGLSGTGKTTLSADPSRTLIGDDEHGWSDVGIFNFEGGCYAKVIRLSPIGEPEIYEKTSRFGTVLENVVIDPTRHLDLDSDHFTENTRAAYAIETISNADQAGLAGQPRSVIFLTADAFGVLPPVARLTPEQAMFHFISGYTAKVAGTERGVTEPKTTFSACFGAPFLPLHPMTYAELLRERLNHAKADVWLINTGWTGGAYGVGHRMSLEHTRTIVTAVLNGSLKNGGMRLDPIFRFQVPLRVAGVPTSLLDPRSTWSDPAAYDQKAAELARKFRDNFTKYADHASPEVAAAAPRV